MTLTLTEQKLEVELRLRVLRVGSTSRSLSQSSLSLSGAEKDLSYLRAKENHQGCYLNIICITRMIYQIELKLSLTKSKSLFVATVCCHKFNNY